MQNQSIFDFSKLRGSSLGRRTAQIYYQLKEPLKNVKILFLGSTLQKYLALAVKFVIFMAQRSSANIAVLRVRAKFTIILSDSVKC